MELLSPCLFTQEGQREEKHVSLELQRKEHVQVRIFLLVWLLACRTRKELLKEEQGLLEVGIQAVCP